MLFTDTDILTYEIKSKDAYECFFKHKHLFDLSNYPKDSELFVTVNEGIIDKMKYVYKEEPIRKFVGIKPKCIVFFWMMVKNLIQRKK